jgi:succinoglycan biosynthesis protein ExoW
MEEGPTQAEWNSGATIAAVIPFYQKRAGILPDVVRSALTQRDVPPFPIIVVDDASPIPARQELAELCVQWPGRIRIIEQQNAGPGAARNKGLDHVPAGTRYVAFLDSDDIWMDNHLSRAIFALEKGYDFYFSDFYFPTYKQESAFNRAKRIRPSDHKAIPGIENLFEYGHDLFNQVLTGNVIGTPTVVYRYEAFPAVRFREEFFNGQDYLFWLDFSLLSRRIVFSSLAECDCGVGLNIYSGAGWGSERSLDRSHNEIKLWRFVERVYPLTAEQRKYNEQRLQRLRRGFVEDVLHRIRRGRLRSLSILGKHVKVDPTFPISFLPISTRIALDKFMGARKR